MYIFLPLWLYLQLSQPSVRRIGCGITDQATAPLVSDQDHTTPSCQHLHTRRVKLMGLKYNAGLYEGLLCIFNNWKSTTVNFVINKQGSPYCLLIQLGSWWSFERDIANDCFFYRIICKDKIYFLVVISHKITNIFLASLQFHEWRRGEWLTVPRQSRI